MTKAKTAKKRSRLRVGDYLRIPLPDGRYAFGQYLLMDAYGPLVRIFDLVTTEQNVPEDLSTRKLLFPPVYVGLGAALKERHWQIVGKGPIGDFTFPKFRFSFGLKPGTYHDWKIYDGKTLTKIGDLPVELRSLEILAGWPAQAVEDRILTGKFPGVFDDVY